MRSLASSASRDELIPLLNHQANLSRMDSDGVPPRWDVYLTGWRCSFFSAGSPEFIEMRRGLSSADWVAIGVFYGHARPKRGDRMTDLRTSSGRRRLGDVDTYSVVEVLPLGDEGVFRLLLSEAGTR